MTIHNTTITNGRVLTPEGKIIQESVTLEDGCIRTLGGTGKNTCGREIPAEGLLVLPVSSIYTATHSNMS